MTNHSFTAMLSVSQTPHQVFAAVANPRLWWSETITGRTDLVGAEFDYHYKDLHRCKLKVVDLVPGKSVVWRVLDNHFSFTRDKTEWTGTELKFAIARTAEGTELRFTHLGLVPEYECYDACTEGWTNYINGSLKSLITTGQGRPNAGEAQTESERSLVA